MPIWPTVGVLSVDACIRLSDGSSVETQTYGQGSLTAPWNLRSSPRRRRSLETACEDRAAGVLVMGVAGLDLLRDRVHVAEAALELVGGKHGRGAGHAIGGVDHCSRLVDGPGRGDAQR